MALLRAFINDTRGVVTLEYAMATMAGVVIFGLIFGVMTRLADGHVAGIRAACG